MTRTIRCAAVAAAVLTCAGIAGFTNPANADVSSVIGSAYGYSLTVSLLGSPPNTRGAGQVDCAGPNNPPGCADTPTVSSSPAVTLPAAGGNVSSSKPTGATAQVGPATFFSATALSASSSGSTGPGGSVTSSASATGVNASGNEAFTASSVSSTCTASETGTTGSTSIAGGSVQTDNGLDLNMDDDFTDPGEHGPTFVGVGTNPAPNTTITGHLHVNNTVDNFEYIFNEQVLNSDGSITVNAVHQRLLGNNAVGDLYIARSVCGAVVSGAPANVGVSINDSSDPILGGDSVTYTLSVGNSGASTANDVAVSMTLSNARLLSATASSGTCTVLKGKTKSVDCALGTIAGGGSTTITVVAKAPKKAGTMSLSATASASNDPSAASDTESTTVT